jgi:hypothetical protein
MKTALSEDEFIIAAREFQDAIRKTAQAAQKKAGGVPAGGEARGMSADDKQALDWANANPNDPRAAQIKQRLGM